MSNDEKSLKSLTIKGFKSIRDLEDFELRDLNVIVGGNGAGKSNFVSFFKLLNFFVKGYLNSFVVDNGGAGDILFNGRKATSEMEFVTKFGERGFRFKLVPTPNDSFSVEYEARFYERSQSGWWSLGSSEDGTSRMAEEVKKKLTDWTYSEPVYNAILSWCVYHFHDTTSTSGMRHYEIVQDNDYLRNRAENIAPFLLKLKEEFSSEYHEIVDVIRLALPFFDDFILSPRKRGQKEEVNLSWRQKGNDYPMQPYHLSDGSIRFICLATALLQPNPPSTIIIDEPELGLHPEAIALLAELIQAASQRTQVIIATQSPELLNYFSIDDIIVTRRKDGASTFERLDEKDYSEWLKDYSVGELWVKNVIQGGAAHE
jgi:predicted ATPase